MNKIYKVVWNASIGTWTVVSELAKSKTRTGSVSSSSEITSSQNEIISREKKFRPKALVLSIISCLAASHVWADYTNLYGSIIDTSPTISNGIAIGANTGTPATANDSNGLAVGSRANASAADSTALGNYVNATGVNSTVVGGQASAAGAQSIALQNNSDADLVAEGLATGSSFTAVDSASSYSVAIGAMSQVVGSTAAMAIGKNAQVNSGANNATAIGNTATVDTNAVDGVAIGTNSLTSAANSVSLGPRSTASVTNSVALGAGATTTVQSGNSYITNVAASTTNGVVSVGSATNTRRIQNVADGAADSDAVTVAQLKDVNNRAVGNTTALGGGAAYNPATDVYTPPSYTITKTDGTTYTPVNTVSGALTNLNNEVVKPITFAGNTGSSANNLGTTLNITGAGSTAGTYSGNNLKTAVTGNTVNIQMADEPVFSGTVTAGNLTTGGSLNVTGASNLNGGANLNNQKITNLAAGTISSTSTDAVNGSQLNTTNQNVTTAQNTANTAVTNAAAAQNTANTAVTNAAAAQATADKGLNFSVNGGTADNVKLGETVNFANGTNTTAVYDPATNTYKYNVNDNIALTNAGSLTVGNSKVDNSGLTITGGPSVTTAGINAGNQKITNVAAGTVSSTSTDAVNGSQLNTTNQNVTTAQNTANTAVTNAAAAQNTANTAVTNAAAAQATADKGLNFSVNGGTADNVKLGETVNFANGTNTTAVYDPTTNTYKYNVNDNIALTNAGSLTVGNSKVDNSGLTITGGPSVTTAGINAGNQKITNVAAGTISATSTDAVNGSQLNTTNQNVTTAQNTANTAVTNAAAAQNTANTAVTNAAAAQATADKGLNFSVNGGTADNVKLGETVNFADGTNTTAVYDPTTNTYKYNVNDNIALTNAGSLTVGNSKVDNSGLTITGGPSVTTAGINAGNQKITNVAAGTISASSTDAVNGSQLNTTNQNVTTAQNTANTAVTNAAAAQATADKGLNFSVNGGTADNVKLGETINFADGTNTTAVYDPATNTYKYNVNDNIALTNAGSLTVGNSKVDNSGLTITGGPSVTTAGINAGNQKITNVAAGTNATDAVNVSQLDALSTSSNNKTDALGNSTANNLGGGSSYDSSTGAVSSPTYTVNGNNVNNVGDAITALDKGWTLQSNGANAAAVKAGDTVDIGTVAGETNLKVSKTGNTIQYGLNRDLNIDSVTAGDSKLDTNGLSIAGGPSVTKTGIDAAGNTITNVAAGTNATDAVNKGQLDALSTSSNNKTDALGNSTANNLGGGSSYDSTTGVVSSPTYTVNGNNVNNVGDAITALDKGWTLQSNGANAAAVKAGDTVDIGTVAGESNLKVSKTGNTIQYGLNRDLNIDSVTAGDSKLDSNGLSIAGGPSVTKTGIDAAGNTISNVAAGTNATDAVNKGQLDALSTSSNNKTDALGNSTANNLGGGASYDSTTGVVSSPTYVTTKTDGTTINANNVGDALTNLNNEVVKPITFAGNSGSVDRKLGETLNITGGLTASGSNSNVKTVISGNTVDIQLADAPVFAGKLTANGLDANGEKVTNVGAGTAATDAVNKGQLDALSTSSNNKTDALGNSTANNLGGGSSYDSTTGAVSSPTYTVNGNNVNNVGDAITALDKGWTLQSNGANAAAVKAGDTVDIGTVAGESNLKVTKTGNTIQYGLNRDLNIDSVTAGDSKLDTNGLTIAGGPSVTKSGIDAAGNTISNVAAGTNATDAVNKGQLDALSTSSNNKTDALGNSTANNLGGGSSYDSTTGAVSSPTYTVNGNNVNNVGDAITALDKGWTLQSNGANAAAVKAGDTVDIGTVAGESNLKVSKTGNTIQYGLNRDLNIDSVTAGDSKLDSNGLSIAGGPSVTKSGIDAAGNTISNVAAGTNATDAVNKGQLDALSTSSNNKTDALGNSTANNLGGGASYDSTTGAVSSPTYVTTKTDGTTVNANNVGDALTNLNNEVVKPITFAGNSGSVERKLGEILNITGGLTASGSNSNVKTVISGNTVDIQLADAPVFAGKLTANGLDANGEKVTNVGAGTNATDAVNKGQLDALSTSSNNKTDALGNSTANNLGGGSSYDSSTGAVSSPTYVTTKTDGTTINANNVGDALTNLNNEVVKPITFAGNSGSVDRKLGETLNITGGLTASGSNSNVKTVISGNTVDIQLADAPVFAGKLTANGLDANGEKVTNVGAGTNATDAVNKGQLDALSTSSNNKTDALGNSTANNLGGGASYDSTTGAVSSPTYTVNGNNVNNVGDAITALDKGWTLQSNGANAAAVKAGDTVDIGTVAGESNLKVTKTGNTIQYGLNRDLNIDSVTTGDSKLDSNGLSIAGGPSVTKTGIDAAGNTISNVAAGTTATDAVNKGQLDALSTSSNNKTDALGNSTANNLGGGASYDSTTGAVSSPTYVTTKTDGTTVNANNVGDALTNLNNEVVKPITFAGNSGSVDRKLGETLNITGGLTASGSNSNVKTVISGNTVDIQLADAPVFAGKLTANGLDANGEKVTNVGVGTNATDAVNKGQLDALSTSSNNKTDALGNSTANNLGGGASYDSSTGAVSSPTYTVNGNNVNNVGDAITALDKGWTLQSNGTNAAAVKAGDTVDIGTVAGESNLKVSKTGNTIQYGLNRDLNIDSVTAGDSKLDSNGLSIAGGPSVTKSGIDAAGNTISNVAAGTNATDAVNKAQLDHVDNRVTQVTNTTASIFGGGAKANPDGSISNPTYNVAGTSANNVGDALTALDKAVTDAGTAANAGWTVSANGDAATAKKIKPNGKVNFTGDDNLTVAQTSQTDNEGNIKVALNKNLKVDSVTTGNTVIDTTGVKVGDNVQLGSTGLIIAGGPSITTSGISAGNKTISNVAAGVSSTDAVNKGQLDSAISSINNNVGALANSAVQYDKNSDGTVNKDSITLAGGANGTTIKNVANGTVAEGSKDAVNGGQLWTVQQQVDKNTGDISNLQTDISNINNGKSGLVQQADKDAAITVGKDTGGTQVNVSGTAGERTVTGVKAGAVTATSKDAVNGSQLNTTNQALVNYLGGGAGYDNITQSFSNPTYNVGDKSYNNVGDAIGALNQADQTLNTKIDNVSNKLEQAFYATNQRIDDVEKRANAGIAAAMALENAPFVAGKYTYAVGAAYHGGENAVGVTLRKTADNGRWSLTGGVAAASQGDPSVRIGISGVID
ncbi:ESPR-type extended signal peptide-containing protein [Acinetobacter nosocomialis]|uniref:ESPR-type extended signal peptide-containing protein n=1 Tax=Acinetobacter nosocomialis TaxID=106654 RepID=UPI0025A1BCEC|nr:ESPR-type extended signal peptide-containing protein [Acinetobacter nosocomialis]